MLATLTAALPPEGPMTLAMDKSELVMGIAVGGVVLIVLAAIVFTQMRQILVARAREATRREIAAYVAEGSMTPDDAARLLGAEQSEFERKIGEAVKWGMISPAKAEKLIHSVREKSAPAGDPRY